MNFEQAHIGLAADQETIDSLIDLRIGLVVTHTKKTNYEPSNAPSNLHTVEH
jgi:hypothetical protein